MSDRSQGAEPRWQAFAYLLLFLVPCAAAAVLLLLESGFQRQHLHAATAWFDPFFFLYNVGLALFAIAIVPLLTYFYVETMRREKLRRLKHDLKKEWADCQHEVGQLIQMQFRFRNYLGSLAAVIAVIAAGVFIILLLRPYFPPVGSAAAAGVPASLHGVDYGRGANVLLLGPAIELAEDARRRPEYYHQIVVALCAFEFGFLGAYIYFIGQLLRAYFTLDLSPHTFVAGAIRMTTSSVMALVLSFALSRVVALPVIAFFLGYFPDRALLWLERLGDRALALGRKRNAEHPLGRLAGMSASAEARLEREGFDNLETLSHGDPVRLAVHTGFGYQQLKHWIGEARLRLQLGGDYDDFASRTWIRTLDDLRAFYAETGDRARATAELARCFGDEPKMALKLGIAGSLLVPSPAPAAQLSAGPAPIAPASPAEPAAPIPFPKPAEQG